MKNEKKNIKESPKNILSFFALMVIIMLTFDFIMDNLYPFISQMIFYGKFGRQVVVEGVCAIIVLIVLILFGNSYIFKEKKVGFFKSILAGGFILGFATMMLLTSIVEINGKANYLDVGSLILYCLLIGVFEEFLCRGWIQNEFIEKFANNRKQVILSIFLSSLIFGGIHISNIWIGGQTVIETIAQIIQATGIGVLLGTIYYRTKNIWSVVFLHGYWDFAILLSEINTIKSCTEGPGSIEFKIVTLITSTAIALAYIFIGLYVFRKEKTQGCIKDEVLSDEDIIRDKKKSKKFIPAAILCFSVLFVVELPEVETTCYEYEPTKIEYQEIMTPAYEEYSIEELNLKIYINNKNKLTFYNTTTKDKKELIKEYIKEFAIIEENGRYKILVLGLNKYQSATIVYYSDYININEYKEDKDYLDKLSKSFEIIDSAPSTKSLKYIVSQNSNKYFVIEAMTGELLVLKDNELGLLINEKPFEENRNAKADNHIQEEIPDVPEIPVEEEIMN